MQFELPTKFEALPAFPYPCLVFDIGVYFRNLPLMKKLDKCTLEEIPWHTPIVTNIAFRIWSSSEEPSEITHIICHPSINEIVEIGKQEIRAKKDFDISKLYESLAKSSGLSSNEYMEHAIDTRDALELLFSQMLDVRTIVSHNLRSDLTFLKIELYRRGMMNILETLIYKELFCTMQYGMKYCNTKLPGKRPRWPKLTELYYNLFGEDIYKTPYAIVEDVEIVEDCYHELIRLKR